MKITKNEHMKINMAAISEPTTKIFNNKEFLPT